MWSEGGVITGILLLYVMTTNRAVARVDQEFVLRNWVGLALCCEIGGLSGDTQREGKNG